MRLGQSCLNQGNIVLFVETAGRHCACNALFFKRMSVIWRTCYWKVVDLGYILVGCNKLYKSVEV